MYLIMSNEQIKISIIIPTYNRVATIGNTIDSFIAQTYNDWEMLVVDDHSTDNTKEVIESYSKKDGRIYYLSNERAKGAQGARNTGILHSTSEWICLFDSDDYAYPDFLSKMVETICEDVDVVTSYLNLITLEKNTQEVAKWGGDGNLEKDLMTGEKYVAFNMTLIRKSKLIQIGLLDENCFAYQEFDTHLSLSRICAYKAVREVLSDYYLGRSDSISVRKNRNIDGRIYIFCKHHARWRKIAYWSFVKYARLLYFKANKTWKRKLVCIAPEIIPIIPLAYIKRKLLCKKTKHHE